MEDLKIHLANGINKIKVQMMNFTTRRLGTGMRKERGGIQYKISLHLKISKNQRPQ